MCPSVLSPFFYAFGGFTASGTTTTTCRSFRAKSRVSLGKWISKNITGKLSAIVIGGTKFLMTDMENGVTKKKELLPLNIQMGPQKTSLSTTTIATTMSTSGSTTKPSLTATPTKTQHTHPFQSTLQKLSTLNSLASSLYTSYPTLLAQSISATIVPLGTPSAKV